MHRLLVFPLCLLALLTLAASSPAASKKKGAGSPPKITATWSGAPIFVGATIPDIKGAITDKNGDLSMVKINWGNGTKTSWDDVYGAKSVSVLDTMSRDVFYMQVGTYTVTITAWDKRKKRTVKRLTVQSVEYDPILEEQACLKYGCAPSDPDPELGPDSLYPELL